MLLLYHPNVAGRSCELCQKYQFNEKTGEIEKQRGKRLLRQGKTPCRMADGCPKGTPENTRELSPKNWQAYRHYLQCKATGLFPDDPIVARNAAVVRAVEDAYERGQRERQIRMMESIAIHNV